MAANLQLFEAFDNKFEEKKKGKKKFEKIFFEKNFFFENFHFLRPSSNAAAPHARIAEILITPLAVPGIQYLGTVGRLEQSHPLYPQYVCHVMRTCGQSSASPSLSAQ